MRFFIQKESHIITKRYNRDENKEEIIKVDCDILIFLNPELITYDAGLEVDPPFISLAHESLYSWVVRGSWERSAKAMVNSNSKAFTPLSYTNPYFIISVLSNSDRWKFEESLDVILRIEDWFGMILRQQDALIWKPPWVGYKTQELREHGSSPHSSGDEWFLEGEIDAGAEEWRPGEARDPEPEFHWVKPRLCFNGSRGHEAAACTILSRGMSQAAARIFHALPVAAARWSHLKPRHVETESRGSTAAARLFWKPRLSRRDIFLGHLYFAMGPTSPYIMLAAPPWTISEAKDQIFCSPSLHLRERKRKQPPPLLGVSEPSGVPSTTSSP